MREKFNQLWGYQLKVLLLAVGIITGKHFLLGLDEI